MSPRDSLPLLLDGRLFRTDCCIYEEDAVRQAWYVAICSVEYRLSFLSCNPPTLLLDFLPSILSIWYALVSGMNLVNTIFKLVIGHRLSEEEFSVCIDTGVSF